MVSKRDIFDGEVFFTIEVIGEIEGEDETQFKEYTTGTFEE